MSTFREQVSTKAPPLKVDIFTPYALSDTPDVSAAQSADRDILLTVILDITLDSVEMTVSFKRYEDAELTNCETIQQSVSLAGFNDSVAVNTH